MSTIDFFTAAATQPVESHYSIHGIMTRTAAHRLCDGWGWTDSTWSGDHLDSHLIPRGCYASAKAALDAAEAFGRDNT